jgi:hypothetical protein
MRFPASMALKVKGEAPTDTVTSGVLFSPRAWFETFKRNRHQFVFITPRWSVIGTVGSRILFGRFGNAAFLATGGVVGLTGPVEIVKVTLAPWET